MRRISTAVVVLLAALVVATLAVTAAPGAGQTAVPELARGRSPRA